MIRLTLAFITLSALASLIHTADTSSLDFALRMALMGALGVVAGILYAIDSLHRD